MAYRGEMSNWLPCSSCNQLAVVTEEKQQWVMGYKAFDLWRARGEDNANQKYYQLELANTSEKRIDGVSPVPDECTVSVSRYDCNLLLQWGGVSFSSELRKLHGEACASDYGVPDKWPENFDFEDSQFISLYTEATTAAWQTSGTFLFSSSFS